MLVGAALSVEAFSARPVLAPSHPTAVMRTSPVMEMVPARRAQLAGLLGATLTGITAQGASAATGPSSTSTFPTLRRVAPSIAPRVVLETAGSGRVSSIPTARSVVRSSSDGT